MSVFPRVPTEEVIERKIELRSIKPHSKSLDYITVCGFEGSEGGNTYYNFMRDSSLTESFERYVGFPLGDLANGVSSRSEDSRIMRGYSEALEREIKQTKWLLHPCKRD